MRSSSSSTSGGSALKIQGERFLVTGGLGFVGRHLVRALVARGASCVVLDRAADVAPIRDLVGAKVTVLQSDVLTADLASILRDCTAVVHLAASADVRAAEGNPREVFENNVLATARILEAMRTARVTQFAFPSTSTVYGEPKVVPTPEDYSPLAPISLYGASKLAGEGLICGWTSSGAGTAVVLRLANVVGGGATHGVVFDFVRRLQATPGELEILGREPGTSKSYVHIDDTIEAFLLAWSKRDDGVAVYNVGSEDTITVKELADAVCLAMGLPNMQYRWSGGVDGGGWKGDVKRMGLAVDRLKAIGWRPRHTSAQAVANAAKALAA